MRQFAKIALGVVLLAGWVSPSVLAQGKKPKATDTTGVTVIPLNRCEDINSKLKAGSSIVSGSIIMITADLPWCDVRAEVPGITITALATLAADDIAGKPEGFAMLHSVTLTSAFFGDPNIVLTSASGTILRNLWIDSRQGTFLVTPKCTSPNNCPAPVPVDVHAVDAVAVNADPVFTDADPSLPNLKVRELDNLQLDPNSGLLVGAPFPSRLVTVENGFITAGRNGVVALRAIDDGAGADALTIADMDIRVSDPLSSGGQSKAGILLHGASGVSIVGNLIAGDPAPALTEAVGILVDDPALGGGSSPGISIDQNRFSDLLAIAEINNHLAGSFSRNDTVQNVGNGVALLGSGGIIGDPLLEAACQNRDTDALAGHSALWVIGQNKIEASTGNAFEVADGCAHTFGNNVIRVPNIGISLLGTASYNSIAGNNLSDTLLGVFLGVDTSFNDIIGRSGGIFQEAPVDGGVSSNSITGNRIFENPANPLARITITPDHS